MAAPASASTEPASLDVVLEDIIEIFDDDESYNIITAAKRIVDLWNNGTGFHDEVVDETSAVAFLLRPSTRERVNRDAIRSWLSYFCLRADGSVSLGAGVQSSLVLARATALAFQGDPLGPILDAMLTQGIGGEPDGFESPEQQKECLQDAPLFALTWSSPSGAGALGRRLVLHERGLPGGRVYVVPAVLLQSEPEGFACSALGVSAAAAAELRGKAVAALARAAEAGPAYAGEDDNSSGVFMAVSPTGEATVCGPLLDVVLAVASGRGARPLWPCVRPCRAVDVCFATAEEADGRAPPGESGEGVLTVSAGGDGLTLHAVPVSKEDAASTRLFTFPASRGGPITLGEWGSGRESSPGEARVFASSSEPSHVAPGSPAFPTLARALAALSKAGLVDHVKLPGEDGVLRLLDDHCAALSPVDAVVQPYFRSGDAPLPVLPTVRDGGAPLVDDVISGEAPAVGLAGARVVKPAVE